MNTRKKLIEVALPLEKINAASAREKSIRHGHPSTLHLWWARRPLAAARAVIFAQMVDDPSAHPETFPTEEAQAAERERLFRLIEQLVLWENTTNEDLLTQARAEIWKSWRVTCAENQDHPRAAELFNPDKLPAFHDPFAGGGSLPLEAQRLGLEAYASDLNPVAVLINKAMIEIPPKFAGQPPVNPESRKHLFTAESAEERRGSYEQTPLRPSPSSAVDSVAGAGVSRHFTAEGAAERRGQDNKEPLRTSAFSAVDSVWRGATGLAADVRYYGQWMRDEAEKRIGHLYPKIAVTAEMAEERPDLRPYVGKQLTVIAWLWARTVKSPNPAFAHVDVPLVSNFMLSTKAGKEAYVEPVIAGDSYRFTVQVGAPPDPVAAKSGTKLSRGANFRCIMSETPIEPDYIKAEGKAGRMGARLMAIVAEGERGRVYLAPTPEHEAIVRQARTEWEPETSLPDDPRNFWTVQYGLTNFGDLFTPRQLVALNTFSDLVQEARERVCRDAQAAGLPNDERGLDAGGSGAVAYAEAVGMYLGMTVSKMTSYHCTLGIWRASDGKSGRAFGRQAIPMVWDYPECNPFAGAGGDWEGACNDCAKVLTRLGHISLGVALQSAAQGNQTEALYSPVISTDPPYYDNVGYADLSDFFYVWLRRSLRPIFSNLFGTLAVPKAEELVATPYRHGDKEKAEKFFLDGMTTAMQRLAVKVHPTFPVTIYYAFKQSESNGVDGTASTGWETFLDAVLRAGFSISGTLPMRTEQSAALKSIVNSLATSIVLVCRPRHQDAPTVTRRDFLAVLKDELPKALRLLQLGNIAPVDLAQAAIGPGMAVYTRYARVLDATGTPLSVREALILINQTLDEVLAEQEGDFDADTRWALAWFEQYGFNEGEYGVAETLSTAKNTSVSGMVTGGLLTSRAGKVRLLRPNELPAAWNPATDTRLTVWEMVHHLVRTLDQGEPAAAALLAHLGDQADTARELAYRLYTVCERKKRAAEALAYNSLVQSWPEIQRLARAQRSGSLEQARLFTAEDAEERRG